MDFVAGELSRFADCLESFESPTGAAPKYAIKLAVEALEKFYRGNLGRPNWETIGKIISEIFPDARKNGGGDNLEENDYTDWIRQLARRK